MLICAGLGAAAAASAQTDCAPVPAGVAQMAGVGVQAAWQADPAPITVGRPFALLISLCPAQTQLLRVDASMPEHRHGMNYRPTLHDLGGGAQDAVRKMEDYRAKLGQAVTALKAQRGKEVEQESKLVEAQRYAQDLEEANMELNEQVSDLLERLKDLGGT